jgi:hypothetical protein
MILNRFTSLDNLFTILKDRKLRLSDPTYWEDKNDIRYMEGYRKLKNLKKVLALCFTNERETIYHWSVFDVKTNTCCIEFDGDLLLDKIKNKAGFNYGKVNYLTISELQTKLTSIDDIPFCKRHSYRNEAEYRIIYDSKLSTKDKSIPIELDLIRKITINQNLCGDVFNLIKSDITNKYNLQVDRSTIYYNNKWINYLNKFKKSRIIKSN